VLEPPAGRPRPALRALLLEAPPAILYDAFVCVIVRNVHSMKIMYDEHECLHGDEQFHFYFTE
jgi:hypothetical protein